MYLVIRMTRKRFSSHPYVESTDADTQEPFPDIKMCMINPVVSFLTYQFDDIRNSPSNIFKLHPELCYYYYSKIWFFFFDITVSGKMWHHHS